MSTAIHRPHFVGVARFVALAALLSVAVCSVSQDRQKAANASTANVQEQIKELISMHAKAADEANPTLASSVWCDSSEASLINPVGRWQGVEQIMGFYRHDMGEMYSTRDLEISDVSVRVYSDAAWAEFKWNFSAKRREDHHFHFTAWKPRFIASAKTGGAWFMFTILRCPPKRSRERNEGAV
jgi:SnoaL-like domain